MSTLGLNPGFHLWRLHLFLKWMNQHFNQRAVCGRKAAILRRKKRKIDQIHCIGTLFKKKKIIWGHLFCTQQAINILQKQICSTHKYVVPPLYVLLYNACLKPWRHHCSVAVFAKVFLGIVYSGITSTQRALQKPHAGFSVSVGNNPYDGFKQTDSSFNVSQAISFKYIICIEQLSSLYMHMINVWLLFFVLPSEFPHSCHELPGRLQCCHHVCSIFPG